MSYPPASEYWAVLPEMILAAAMCIILLVPVLPPFRSACRRSHKPMLIIGILGLLGAALASAGMLNQWFGTELPDHAVLGSMLTVDRYSMAFKIVLYLFSMFVLWMWGSITSRQTRTVDGPDYVSLILGAVLGMSLMASASNFLMIFLAIETASFPSFALAGFHKTTRRGSEAGMKYVLFGAVSSAVMLYGLSMLYGVCGTLDIPTVASVVAEQGLSVGVIVGFVGLLIGVGFKLSAVPMHFWCPDVFEAAPIEVTTFLSVASKGAAIILLGRLILTLGFYLPDTAEAHRMANGIATCVGIVGLVTATWGNLGAYYQENIKRLLAYSSIAHAGYMIMAAGLVSSSLGGAASSDVAGIAVQEPLAYALLFYVIVYSFMNFGAFTIAASVARSTGSENLRDYAGLGSRQPVLAILLGCFLMCLFGMPGTGGFLGKVYLGFEMWSAGMWWLVAGLVINTVFSLYLYMKPIIFMVFTKPDADRPAVAPVTVVPAAWLLMFVALIGILATGIFPDQVTGWARSNAALNYRSRPLFTPNDNRTIAATMMTADDETPADDHGH
ncbi:MAG: NADH-quinone oxidoreductase subunit N [Planctomycetes bacterium]|nr:NADH-quinone oxidoreductase subunit N [Planctomycetota bacterium]